MKKPDTPANEAARLNALCRLNILDSEPEERFDRLTRMAKRMFQVPIALVSLVDAKRQWFKSGFGVGVSETHRDISFCGHAILGTETFVIPNTTADERFADNPLVTGEPNIRFYAGCPIRTLDGYTVGTLCVADTVARIFHDEDIEMLHDLARMVEKELAAMQMATMDDLTGISNRRGFYLIAEHSLSLCLRHKSPATIAIFDLDNFKPINDQFGHVEGDRVLKLFATELQNFFRDSDLVARIGGDEYCALLLNTGASFAEEVIAKLKDEFDIINNSSGNGYNITFSVGMAHFDPAKPKTIQQIIEAADAKLYEQKRGR